MQPDLETILVTGASGFIGHAIVTSFGSKAIGLIGPRSKNDGHSFDCDLTDSDAVKKLVRKLKDYPITHIVHAAAVTPWSENPDFSKDIEMAKSVVLLCKELKVSHLIFISGWNVYDMSGEPPFSEDTQVLPVGEYGASKFAVENFLTQNLHQTKLLILRAASIYGIGQVSAGLIPNLVKSALEIRAMTIDAPSVRRDYLYIGDFVQTIKQIVDSENDGPGGILNVGSGRSESIIAVAETVKSIFKTKYDIDVTISQPDTSQGVVIMDNQLDIGKAQASGLLLKPRSLSEGLGEYINWRRHENIL